MTEPHPPRDLTALLLDIVVIGALIVGTFWILRPFMAAIIWATTIVVVTWPVLLRMQARLWNNRALAIAAMLVILLLLFVIPLILAVATLAANADEIARQVRHATAFRMPDAPSWLAGLPLVGDKVAEAWHDIASSGVEGVWERLMPYAGSVTAWFVAEAGTLGVLLLEFLLTLVLASVLYAKGERAGRAALRFGFRLGGKRGEDLVHLAELAVRGVALGVGLTAVIQSLLGGIGLALAGVPFIGVMTALLFILCITQIGMLVLLIPAVVWVYWSGHPGWGTFLLIWSLIASLLDTVLRPILVRRTADLPMLLIFAGVIGGLIAFGLVGLFVGPVVLAVAFTLLQAWLEERAVPRER